MRQDFFSSSKSLEFNLIRTTDRSPLGVVVCYVTICSNWTWVVCRTATTLCTVCPGSSDPFYIASLLYKMGHYFLDILYINSSVCVQALTDFQDFYGWNAGGRSCSASRCLDREGRTHNRKAGSNMSDGWVSPILFFFKVSDLDPINFRPAL